MYVRLIPVRAPRVQVETVRFLAGTRTFSLRKRFTLRFYRHALQPEAITPWAASLNCGPFQYIGGKVSFGMASPLASPGFASRSQRLDWRTTFKVLARYFSASRLWPGSRIRFLAKFRTAVPGYGGCMSVSERSLPDHHHRKSSRICNSIREVAEIRVGQSCICDPANEPWIAACRSVAQTAWINLPVFVFAVWGEISALPMAAPRGAWQSLGRRRNC